MAKKYYRKKKKMAKVSKNVKKYVKKAIKAFPEVKFSMGYIDSVVVRDANSTPFYFCLTNIAQGSSVVTRVGDSYNLMDFELRLMIGIDPTSTTSNKENWFRMLVFQWHTEVDGTDANLLTNLPITGNVLEIGANSSGALATPDSLYDIQSKSQKNYTILHDKLFHLQNNIVNATNGPYYNNNMFHKIVIKKHKLSKAHKKLQFNNASTNVAANHIFLVILTYTDSATTAPIAWGTYRVTYTDA